MGVSWSCLCHHSNRIAKEELKPGDHIYSWRSPNIYAHHGIYVGDDKVIHYMGGGEGKSVHRSFCSSSSQAGGVSECNLDCFLSGGDLCVYQYDVTPQFVKEARGGTCTTVASDPSECVLPRARDLLNRNCFGFYNIFKNNCEDFAIYCKTGLLDVTHLSSGQVASITGWRNKSFTGDTAFQCLDQTPYNIGGQRAFVEIPVEGLIALSESGAHSESSLKGKGNKWMQRLIAESGNAEAGIHGRVVQ